MKCKVVNIQIKVLYSISHFVGLFWKRLQNEILQLNLDDFGNTKWVVNLHRPHTELPTIAFTGSFNAFKTIN